MANPSRRRQIVAWRPSKTMFGGNCLHRVWPFDWRARQLRFRSMAIARTFAAVRVWQAGCGKLVGFESQSKSVGRCDRAMNTTIAGRISSPLTTPDNDSESLWPPLSFGRDLLSFVASARQTSFLPDKLKQSMEIGEKIPASNIDRRCRQCSSNRKALSRRPRRSTTGHKSFSRSSALALVACRNRRNSTRPFETDNYRKTNRRAPFISTSSQHNGFWGDFRFSSPATRTCCLPA